MEQFHLDEFNIEALNANLRTKTSATTMTSFTLCSMTTLPTTCGSGKRRSPEPRQAWDKNRGQERTQKSKSLSVQRNVVRQQRSWYVCRFKNNTSRRPYRYCCFKNRDLILFRNLEGKNHLQNVYGKWHENAVTYHIHFVTIYEMLPYTKCTFFRFTKCIW